MFHVVGGIASASVVDARADWNVTVGRNWYQTSLTPRAATLTWKRPVAHAVGISVALGAAVMGLGALAAVRRPLGAPVRCCRECTARGGDGDRDGQVARVDNDEDDGRKLEHSRQLAEEARAPVRPERTRPEHQGRRD